MSLLILPGNAVINWREKSLASRPFLHPLEESVVILVGNYWIIRYQGEAAILKATRGLDYLAYLLRRPWREVDVHRTARYTYRPPSAGVARRFEGSKRQCSNRWVAGFPANSRFSGQGRIQAAYRPVAKRCGGGGTV